MTEKGIEQKPSETALFATLRRAVANKEYGNEGFGPDYLAEKFLPPHFRFFLKFKKIRTNTKEKLNGFLPGMNEYMIARTVYFDRLFIEALTEQTAQIVLLGAGYDTRAYRFSKLNQGTRIFELDASPTQDQKKKYIQSGRINVPQNVEFVPLNFNTQALEDVLKEAGYQNNQKTLFIWEGVIYYLDAESVDRTFDFIGQSTHAESRIAFDYTVSVTGENVDKYYGFREFSQSMKEHHGNEELVFSIDKGGLIALLKQKGLKLVEHLDNEEIERRFLTKADGKLIGKMTGHFCFALASSEA